MKNRTIQRSIARERMQGVKRLNKPYHAKGDREGLYSSQFARHWREAIGQKPAAKKTAPKPTLRDRFRAMFRKAV